MSTGTFFNCSTLLGARLHSTVEASSCLKVTGQTTKERKTSGVSASFSSTFASGSVGASYANVTEDGQGHKKEDKSGRMNWRREVGRHSWRSSEYDSERVSDRILKVNFPV